LPAIKEKWPAEERGCPIFIQQDNAKTHIAVDDPDFCRVAQEDGWDIRLMCQPPNSPDLNVLDRPNCRVAQEDGWDTREAVQIKVASGSTKLPSRSIRMDDEEEFLAPSLFFLLTTNSVLKIKSDAPWVSKFFL